MDELAGGEAIRVIETTAELVSAYVASNHVPGSELPDLIAATHAALSGLGRPASATPAPVAKVTPAQVRRSITHEALISFEDGRGYKTLRRHLRACGLTPERYREKWGLPRDYPMTSAGYSERRSALARSIGLGLKAAVGGVAAEPPTETAAGAPKRRRRKAKAETDR